MYERNNMIEQLKKNELFSHLSNEQISDIISKVKYVLKEIIIQRQLEQ